MMKRTNYVVTVDHELNEREERSLQYTIQVACEVDGVGVVRVSVLSPGLDHDDAAGLIAENINHIQTDHE